MSNVKIIASDGVTPSPAISQIVGMTDAILRAVQDHTNAHMNAVYEVERQQAEIDRLTAELSAAREDTERQVKRIAELEYEWAERQCAQIETLQAEVRGLKAKLADSKRAASDLGWQLDYDRQGGA